MRTFRPAVLAILAGIGVVTSVAPASATGFCNLRTSPDGFVALRAAPSPQARLIARMKPGDEVLVGLRQQGRWVEVTWWRGQDRHVKGYHHIAGKGWANTRWIQEDC